MCNPVALYQPAAGQLGREAELKWILTYRNIKRRRRQVCLAPSGTVKKASKKVKIPMCKTKKIRVFSISPFCSFRPSSSSHTKPFSAKKLREKRRVQKKRKVRFLLYFPILLPPLAILPPTGCQFGESQSSAGVGSCGSEAAASSDTGLEVSGLCPGVDSGSGGSGWLRMTCTT